MNKSNTLYIKCLTCEAYVLMLDKTYNVCQKCVDFSDEDHNPTW